MLTQRRISMILLGFMASAVVILVMIQIAEGQSWTEYAATVIAALGLCALWFVYWRGWEPARHLTVTFLTVITAVSMDFETLSFGVIVPPIFALIMLNSWWVVGSGLVIQAGILIRAGFQGDYANPVNIVIYLMVLVGLILSRQVTTSAMRIAEANRQRAEDARASAERAREAALQQSSLLHERTADLERTLTELQQTSGARDALTKTIRTIASPVMPVLDGILVMPLIGAIDSERAHLLMGTLLTAIGSHRARLVILDVTGVPIIDTQVAHLLLQTARAAQLLGCQPILVGLRPELAQTIVGLGVNFSDLVTLADLQGAIKYALHHHDSARSDAS